MREVLGSWLLVTGVLLLILLANQIAGVLERAAVNQYPGSMVLELIGLGAVQNLSILLPIGLLLGVVLALGRLYHDSEMTAAFACGARPGVVYRPVALLGVLVTAGLAWLTLVLEPQATARVLNLRSAALRAGQFAPIAPGKFRSFGNGSAVVYAEDANPDGTLANVFVEHSQGPRVEVALAERARHSVSPDGRTQTVTLYDGERFEGVPGSAEYRMLRFAEHVIPVEVPAGGTDPRIGLDAQPTPALLGTGDLEARAELQGRLATPVMCLVLTLLAVPLGRLRPRQGRYARIWLAVVIYFVYSNLVAAGKVWIARGTLPAELGLWWTHAAVILLAALPILGPAAGHRLKYWVERSR